MSHSKIGNILPKKLDDLLLTKLVSKALRESHLDIASMVKTISKVTGINSETIAKWLKHKNPPKATHLLILATYYPAVLKMVFELIDCPELWEIALHKNLPQKMQIRVKEKSSNYRLWGDISVTNQKQKNPIISALNMRQLWFLEELRKGKQFSSSDIVSMWKVNERTAKRDTSHLVKSGIIRFIKSGRTGWYEIIVS